jgi:hypothetical protein
MRVSGAIRAAFLAALVLALSGLPVAAPSALAEPTGKGLISIFTNTEHFVPGDYLELRYSTSPGTLQGPVDLYLVILAPWGQLYFLNEAGGFVTDFAPFRRNVTQPDDKTLLLSRRIDLVLPFGIYTCYMAMTYAGTDPRDSRNWASPVASEALSYAPLSPEQASLVAARGNPDLLAVNWFPESFQKRETWIYLSGEATAFAFVGGKLASQSATPPGGTGPRIDPGLLGPHATLDSLTAALGPPTSVEAIADAPEFQSVSYAFGLEVVLLNGRVSSAFTSLP